MMSEDYGERGLIKGGLCVVIKWKGEKGKRRWSIEREGKSSMS